MSFNGITESDFPEQFYQTGATYKHKDGGLYKTMSIGKSTVDGSMHVIYSHVFPFGPAVYIRPISEWARDKFEMIDFITASEYQKQDRYSLQSEIVKRREARKASNLVLPLPAVQENNKLSVSEPELKNRFSSDNNYYIVNDFGIKYERLIVK